jgi:hypothetical protein
MDAGARYPLTLDPIVQLAELTASDAASGEEFGYSVAASGDTVVVGAPFATVHGVDRQGVVYIFVEPPAGWQNATETAQLTVHDGENQQFGAAVGISGDTVVVGEGNSVNVYIFTKPADGWAPVKPVVKLVGPAAGFGLSVAVSGDTVAVGAPLAGQYNDGVGGAYIYIRPPGGWRLLTTYTCGLGASDSAAGDYFGTSIAVAGNTVVVGAPGSHSTGGAAYVYVEPPGGWPIGMYETGELTVAGASGFASVGTSVAISGNTIVAGAPLINDDLGAAYIFEEPSGGWTSMTQTADLTPDGAVTGSFGDSVAISGSTVIVGSPGATAYHRQEGAAYIFRKPTSGWTDMTGGAKFAPSNGAILDGFGMAVAIADNGAIVVGADQRDENPAAPGKAYIFGPLGATIVRRRGSTLTKILLIGLQRPLSRTTSEKENHIARRRQLALLRPILVGRIIVRMLVPHLWTKQNRSSHPVPPAEQVLAVARLRTRALADNVVEIFVTN